MFFSISFKNIPIFITSALHWGLSIKGTVLYLHSKEWYLSRMKVCIGQLNKAWCSSSTTKHILHWRCSRGVIGMVYLPVSILNLWHESLHLVTIIRTSSFTNEVYSAVLCSRLVRSLYCVILVVCSFWSLSFLSRWCCYMACSCPSDLRTNEDNVLKTSLRLDCIPRQRCICPPTDVQ